jgi:hypothetical protein
MAVNERVAQRSFAKAAQAAVAENDRLGILYGNSGCI